MTHRFSPRPVALVVAAAMSTLAGCQPAGEGGVGQTAVDTAAIMSAADSFRTPYAEAYNAADSATVRKMYSVGVVYLPPEGRPITGRQEVFSVLAGGMTRNLGASIRAEKTNVLGRDAYVEYGIETVRTMSPDVDTALSSHQHGYLMVAERRGDGWKLISVASTMPELLSSP